MIACTNTGSQVTSRVEVLSSGWKMQPVDKLINVDEMSVSLNDFNTESWYDAVVPGTVMGSLASKKVV
jgi:exo-1,4-beta-D-glucosaminidase